MGTPFRIPHGLLSRPSTLPWSNELQRWIPKVFNRMDGDSVHFFWDGDLTGPPSRKLYFKTVFYYVLFKLQTLPCPVALSCFNFQDWPHHKHLNSSTFRTIWWLGLNHPTWIQKVLLGTLAAGQRHFWPREIDFGKVFISLYNSLCTWCIIMSICVNPALIKLE